MAYTPLQLKPFWNNWEHPIGSIARKKRTCSRSLLYMIIGAFPCLSKATYTYRKVFLWSHAYTGIEHCHLDSWEAYTMITTLETVLVTRALERKVVSSKLLHICKSKEFMRMDTHVVTDRICTNYFAIWSSACAPCNDDDDDDDEIMMNSSCYYITATIITFISIFLSSLTMTVAINRSPLSLSMKTKSCYNIR